MPLDSHWTATSELPAFPKLEKDLDVDVVVVGAGITGITAAYLLKKAGKTVALLERDRCATVDTAHTTAHLTYVTDELLSSLVDVFGKDHAQAVWDAGQAAIDQIRTLVEQEQIQCGFAAVPGYLHASVRPNGKDETQVLRKQASLAAELGFDAAYVDDVPYVGRPGVRYSNQAKFHPLQYLSALLKKIEGNGSFVFENSEASQFNADPLEVHANGKTIRCKYVVVATHVPLMGNTGFLQATYFQTKIAPYSSYVVGARLPKAATYEVIMSSLDDPYYYLRVDRTNEGGYAILGGEDHKTGQATYTDSLFVKLEQLLKQWFPDAILDARWTGQVIETHDRLPFIGEAVDRQFIATGFAGNGTTFGTVAAMMAVDAVLERKNPWKDLFSVQRSQLASTWSYLTENIDYPYYFTKDMITAGSRLGVDRLEPGDGRILVIDNQRVAASRDAAGVVCLLSPVCTHMGCLVQWNHGDSTWDCPCHGSRFRATGEVIGGPAETPLAPFQTSEKK